MVTDGFEGLMAAVLSDLTKRSFALASAGSQHGKDGQSALDGGTIVFEAKRYDDASPERQSLYQTFRDRCGQDLAPPNSTSWRLPAPFQRSTSPP